METPYQVCCLILPSLPARWGLQQPLGHQYHLPPADFASLDEESCRKASPASLGWKCGAKIELYMVVQDVISKARWGRVVSAVGVGVNNTLRAAHYAKFKSSPLSTEESRS